MRLGGGGSSSIKGTTVIVKHTGLFTYDTLVDRATILPAPGNGLNSHSVG